MKNLYWIVEWAKIRKDEVVRLPDKFQIHECYLENINKEEFEHAFKYLWSIFINIYDDIANNPDEYGIPLYNIDEYNEFTKQARDSRSAAYLPFNLLYNLLISGVINNEELIVDITKFKTINKVRNTNLLFKNLSKYGFVFQGLNNFIITNNNISLSFPNNKNVIQVLKYMADKAYQTNRVNDFFSCHYKLFQDDMTTTNYGFSVDVVADKMHTKEEQEIIYIMDKILRNKGYLAKQKEYNEGPGYAYYDKESVMNSNGPYHYSLISWKTKLVLFLRIRNASNCIEYLKQCPDTIKQIFLKTDIGCINRINGTCKFGQEYTLDGTTYYRCGCSSAPFYLNPVKDDIFHYINLLELGLKK